MHAYFIPAITIFFIVAVAAPPVLVFIYRWKEVPLRRADVEAMMECAFNGPDKVACQEARQALKSNPYISDPKQTFDRYHSWWRYALPWLVLTALTTVSSYVVYSWVIYQLSPAPAATSTPNANSTTGSGSGSSLLAPASPSPTPAATNAANASSTGSAYGATPASSSGTAAKDGSQKGPGGNAPNSQPDPLVARLSGTIIMALVGGYIWSVFQITARSRSSELSPDDLFEIDLGLLAAVPVGIAFSLLTADLS